MHETLNQLKRLQEFDSLILGLEQKRGRLEAEMHDRQAAVRAREAERRTRSEESQELRRRLDRRELSLREHEEKIAKLTIHLNQVKTNKEYAALQHEIAGHKADASLIEDEVIAVLERIEQAESEGARTQGVADEERLKAESFQKEAMAALQQADLELAAAREQRQGVAGEVTAERLLAYERLLRKQGGKAIAAAEEANGNTYTCAGCFMRLTSNTVNRLMSPHELVFCHSCGRILYLDDSET